jgi:RNA polymerase sigma factor (sigma-70 family)
MGVKQLSKISEFEHSLLQLFHDGDSRALNFVYRKSFHALMSYGQNLIRDEFLVTCILQDCYIKAWAHRQRMESLPHIYRFIRMNLRWQILRHIEKSRKSIYGQTLFLDQIEKTIADFEDHVEDEESLDEYSRKLKDITECIKCLSAESQLIVSLHFEKGLTHKQIAERLGKSTFQVSDQLNKSVKQIKNMVLGSKTEVKNSSGKDIHSIGGILSCQQSKIYELRRNHSLSFGEIATKLGLSQNQTQQHYIRAHQLLQSQSEKKSTKRF